MATLISIAKSCEQRKALAKVERRKVDDPITFNAPVTERKSENRTYQKSKLRKEYSANPQHFLGTSRFVGEIRRPVTISVPIRADKKFTTSHASVKGEGCQCCSKESVKIQGTAKADGRQSIPVEICGDKVSLA